MKNKLTTERVYFDLKESKKHSSEWLIGIDEVGYGCLAGPIVVCSVKISVDAFLKRIDDLKEDFPLILKVKDSKKLSENLRNKIDFEIKSLQEKHPTIIKHGIGEASAEEINTLGVTKAHNLATLRSLENITKETDDCLLFVIDGNKIDECLKDKKVVAFVKGDNLSFSVGCASIIAKTYRDNLMKELSKKYNKYYFEKNKGYGTKEHINALKLFGMCSEHRIKYCRSSLE